MKPLRERALAFWANHPGDTAASVAKQFADEGLKPATLRQWKKRHGLPDVAPAKQQSPQAPPAPTPGPAAAAEWINVHSVIPWDNNPRDNDHAVPAIAQSIAKFGFGRTFVGWRPNGERLLVVGHTARKAVLYLLENAPVYSFQTTNGKCKECKQPVDASHEPKCSKRVPPDAPSIGMIPMRWRSDWTEAEARAYAIADNKLGELSGWVDDELARQLKELEANHGIAAEMLGVDDGELERLLKTLEPPPSPTPSGPAPTPRHGPVTVSLWHGDSLHRLKSLPDNSIDAVVSDPPYGLGTPPPIADVMKAWLAGVPYEAKGGGFMGKEWDAFVPGPELWREVFRVLKPGGHAAIFAGTRTQDWMGIALRLAGFEIRDIGQWCYWSGMPKGHNVSKAIDKAAGAEREVVGGNDDGSGVSEFDITAPATEAAKQWDGWGTALKPAVEPWLLCRKPMSEDTVVANVLKWGTGGLHIDACRFKPGDVMWPGPGGDVSGTGPGPGSGVGSGIGAEVYGARAPLAFDPHALGRFPANLIYSPKASRAEREAGCEGLPAKSGTEITGSLSDGLHNHHPTVKPIGIMRWLVRLLTPPGGTVLDPFMGSGTTAVSAAMEGFNFRGGDLQLPYVGIARARVLYWASNCEMSAPALEGTD